MIDISEVAKRSGLPASTLRFYEEKGLIATMLTPNGPLQLDRTALTARAAEIDSTISTLTAISTALKHAAACPTPDHLQCPTFRGYLDLAAGGLLSESARVRRPK